MTFYLGLTGSIASGKSTAADFFKKRGFDVVDFDQIAHQQLERGTEGWQNIKREFGEKYLNADQTINRKKLGRLVFSDIEQLQKLNELTHPAIEKEADRQMSESRSTLCVAEEPLLFEDGDEKKYDATLLVDIDPKIQLARLMNRNGLAKKEAQRRIDSQMPLRIKRKLADYVVRNDSSVADLHNSLIDMLKKLPLGE